MVAARCYLEKAMRHRSEENPSALHHISFPRSVTFSFNPKRRKCSHSRFHALHNVQNSMSSRRGKIVAASESHRPKASDLLKTGNFDGLVLLSTKMVDEKASKFYQIILTFATLTIEYLDSGNYLLDFNSAYLVDSCCHYGI